MIYNPNEMEDKLKEEKQEKLRQKKYKQILEKDLMPVNVGLKLIMNIIESK